MFGRKSREEDFYNKYPLVKRYFDEGIFKKLYDCEAYTICRVADDTYGVLPKVITPDNIARLFYANTPMIRELVGSNRSPDQALYEMVDAISRKTPEEQSGFLLKISDKNLPFFKDMLEEHKKNGPSKRIDLAFEAELKRIYDAETKANRGKLF